MDKRTPFNLSYDKDIDPRDLYCAAMTLYDIRKVMKLWFFITRADTLEKQRMFSVRIKEEEPKNGMVGRVCLYYDKVCIHSTYYQSFKPETPSGSGSETPEGRALWEEFKEKFLADPPSLEDLYGESPEEYLSKMKKPWTVVPGEHHV